MHIKMLNIKGIPHPHLVEHQVASAAEHEDARMDTQLVVAFELHCFPVPIQELEETACRGKDKAAAFEAVEGMDRYG
jgi:hypothetical protein